MGSLYSRILPCPRRSGPSRSRCLGERLGTCSPPTPGTRPLSSYVVLGRREAVGQAVRHRGVTRRWRQALVGRARPWCCYGLARRFPPSWPADWPGGLGSRPLGRAASVGSCVRKAATTTRASRSPTCTCGAPPSCSRGAQEPGLWLAGSGQHCCSQWPALTTQVLQRIVPTADGTPSSIQDIPAPNATAKTPGPRPHSMLRRLLAHCPPSTQAHRAPADRGALSPSRDPRATCAVPQGWHPPKEGRRGPRTKMPRPYPVWGSDADPKLGNDTNHTSDISVPCLWASSRKRHHILVFFTWGKQVQRG